MPQPRTLEEQNNMRKDVTAMGNFLRTAELLERDHRLVELFIVSNDNLLVATLADDDTSVAPREVVHAPERVNGQEERVNRVSESNHM